MGQELKTIEKERKRNNDWRSKNKEYFKNYMRLYNSDPIIALSKQLKEYLRYVFLKPLFKNYPVLDAHSILRIYEITSAAPKYLKEFLIANYKARYSTDPILDNYAGMKICLIQNISTGCAKTEKEVRDLFHYTNLRLVREEDRKLKMAADRALIAVKRKKKRKERGSLKL